MIRKKDYKKLIDLAIEEDLDEKGDITSNAIFSTERSTFELIARENGILCGLRIFSDIFSLLDPGCETINFVIDGDQIKKDQKICELNGLVVSILKGERTALNFLSHLSGIATKTYQFVKACQGKTRILDTRKTIPGWRKLQKYAVKCGGGKNHRMGLYDLVMIKDNHIDAAGGISAAVKKVRKKWGYSFKIEVETRNIEEVKEAIKHDIDIIMLDNMDLEQIKKALKIINGKTDVEVSGNITPNRIKEISQLDVDFISVGSLTHSVKAFDFSLRKKYEKQ